MELIKPSYLPVLDRAELPILHGVDLLAGDKRFKTRTELPILHGVDYDYEVGRLGGKRITHITWS